MQGVRGRALAALLWLTLSSAAFAAPRLATGEGGFMKLVKLVVRVLDDVRMGFPPG
jgi:hypothetical protein